MGDGSPDRLRHLLEAGPALSIFLKRDHGALLGLYGQVRDDAQYEIENPLTASTMTRYGPPLGCTRRYASLFMRKTTAVHVLSTTSHHRCSINSMTNVSWKSLVDLPSRSVGQYPKPPPERGRFHA